MGLPQPACQRPSAASWQPTCHSSCLPACLPACLQEANEDFQAGEYEWALLNYLKAAEMGAELGQSNAAWMLSEGYGYEGGWLKWVGGRAGGWLKWVGVWMGGRVSVQVDGAAP
jgi:hypothetical protein